MMISAIGFVRRLGREQVNRPLVIAFLTAILTATIQIPLHEGAHWLACLGLGGRGCDLYYNLALGHFPSRLSGTIHLLAGPATGAFLLIAGTLHVKVHSRRFLPAMFAMVSVAAARPILAAGVFIVTETADITTYVDEVALANALGLNPVAIMIAYAVAALVCWIYVVRRVPPQMQSAWVAAVTIGGIGGTFLWLGWLGPTLLPWDES